MLKSEKIIEIIEERYQELLKNNADEIFLDEGKLGALKLYLEKPKNMLFPHEIKTGTGFVTVYVGGDIL